MLPLPALVAWIVTPVAPSILKVPEVAWTVGEAAAMTRLPELSRTGTVLALAVSSGG